MSWIIPEGALEGLLAPSITVWTVKLKPATYMAEPDLRVSQTRLWDCLMAHAQIGARSDGGIDREALTVADKEGRDVLADWCLALGMEVAVDQLGTMFATFAGQDTELDAIAIGSHLDTQPCGGKFDGTLGVLSGLEVIRTLHDAGITPERSITLVNWTAEEGCRFVPSMAASGVYAGVFAMDEVSLWRDAHGIRFVDALREIGYDGAEPVGQRQFSAFLEVHIEQGPVLERQGALIGIVTGAQAMSFNTVTITGRESHAGTTPMALRLDPVTAFTRISAALHAHSDEIGRLFRLIPAGHSD